MGCCAYACCCGCCSGRSYPQWAALREMNKKGVYTPDQVREATQKAWINYNPGAEVSVNKETSRFICRDAVNELGKKGDGQKHNEKLFEESYTKFDKLGYG